MKKNCWVSVIGLQALFLCPGIGQAGPGDVGMGLKVGTLGVGPELTAGLSEEFNTRLGVNLFSYDIDTDVDDIEYEFSLDLFTAGAVIDWHPAGGGFRVSAGVFLNNNELTGDAKAQSAYTIGDRVYTAAQVGTLQGEVLFDSLAPYAGIGWGNAVRDDGRWNFVLDVGVAFQGSPDASLTATGPIATDPTFLANLEKERQSLEDDTDDFKFYPVIALGLSYSF